MSRVESRLKALLIGVSMLEGILQWLEWLMQTLVFLSVKIVGNGVI